MNSLEITMLGPRSCGKTSLLAAMYYQFEKAISGVNLQIRPSVDDQSDMSTSVRLNKRIKELEQNIHKEINPII